MKKLLTIVTAFLCACSAASAFTVTDNTAYGRAVRPDAGKILKVKSANLFATMLYVPAGTTNTQIAALIDEVADVDVAIAASAARATDQIARLSSTDAVEWRAGETVATNAKRTFGGAIYKVVQPHTTQTGWEPPAVPALWAVVADTSAGPAAWVQPTGGHDAYAIGALVTYGGKTWRSLVNANVWPPAEGTLWTSSGTAK